MCERERVRRKGGGKERKKENEGETHGERTEGERERGGGKRGGVENEGRTRERGWREEWKVLVFRRR